MGTTSSSVNYYYNTGQYVGNTQPVDPDIKELKRLIAWKNLRIKSISINTESITIEGTRNKNTYFIVISRSSITVYDSKMKELDRIEIPVPFDSIHNWGTTTIGYPNSQQWTSSPSIGGGNTTPATLPWVTTTNTTIGDYIVDNCDSQAWTSSSCYKVSFE